MSRSLRISLCAAAAIGLAAGAACAEPTVIVTVDVESSVDVALPRQVDLRCSREQPCGLTYITGMLAERGYAATFYLNVYESKQWGEDTLRGLAQSLQSAGHEVALHTHPQWAYDPQRPYMYSYSLADQTRIVADGVRLLQEWTGLPVVSHRAGAYSANRDTIEALAASGIVLDSSLFQGQQHSHLNGEGLPANVPSRVGSVIEIPVTVYERHERPALLGTLAPAYVALGKIDVDSIATPAEAAAAVDAAAAAQLPYIVLFLHSFSFFTAGDTPASLAADEPSMQVFAALLDEVRRKGLPVKTTRDLAASRATIVLGARDTIPTVANVIPTHKYAARMLRSLSPAARWTLAAVALGCAVLACWLLVTVHRRRTARSLLQSSKQPCANS